MGILGNTYANLIIYSSFFSPNTKSAHAIRLQPQHHHHLHYCHCCWYIYTVLLVTGLMLVTSCRLYIGIPPIYVHQVIWLCGKYFQFCGHICFWYISGNNMRSSCCSWLYFGIYVQEITSVCHIISVGCVSNICIVSHLFSDVCQICMLPCCKIDGQ